MSAGPYPDYRPTVLSGDARLPLHWKEGAIKRFYSIVLGKIVTSADEVEMRETRHYLRSANVHDGFLGLEDTKRMWFSASEADALDLLRGDLVICGHRQLVWVGTREPRAAGGGAMNYATAAVTPLTSAHTPQARILAARYPTAGAWSRRRWKRLPIWP